MKKTFTILYLVLFCHVLSFGQPFYGKQAEKHIDGASVVKIKDSAVNPSFIEFRENEGPQLESISQWVSKVYNYQAVELNMLNESNDQLGQTHTRYQPEVNGTPIEFSMFIVHSTNNRVNSVNGTLPAETKSKNSVTLKEDEALKYALKYVGAETYKWDIESEERYIKSDQNDVNATYFPEGKLVLFPIEGMKSTSTLVYAYKFNIYAHKPLSRGFIYVDAQSGKILLENKIIHHVDHEGTALTVYSDTQYIATDSVTEGYRLRETERGNGVRTYDMNMGTSYGNAVDFIDTNNIWNNVNDELDEYATDAHWAAEMTYDYYFNRHDRNSIDDNGFALKSYIHFNLVALGYPDNVNAFWDGEKMSYGDGNAANNISPLTTVDICGHEITHGLTTFTANLVYENESGALNEAFSDILGMSVEFYAKPATANWILGEDIGRAFRSLSNPNDYNQPDTYHGDHWYFGTEDHGGVHTNSGVLNHWYYLTCDGGTGINDNGDSYSVEGIGIEKAEKIAFRTLTVYLTPSAKYEDAKFYAIQSAIDLYGVCSPELAAVSNAFQAIGIGTAYVNEVVADFSSSSNASCSAPLTVNFSNLSHNGLDFVWDFGDGNSSTDANPTHVYTEVGNYTVKLVTSGDTCGTDSIIMVDYVKIDPSMPCVINLEVNTESPEQTACIGKLFDNGGSGGDYAVDAYSQITIAPTGAAQVKLIFNAFDIEAGSGSTCDYDYLKIYDGSSKNAPLIGSYCNTTGIPDTIVSSTGAITLYHYSDGYVTGTGFDIDWECVESTIKPTALFSVNNILSCDGSVTFTDESESFPSNWHWDFGDDNTSDEKNPNHTYTTNGNYSIELIVSNNYGADTLIKEEYIVVSIMEDPIITQDTVCKYSSATLNAEGIGKIYWYASLNDEAILHTGNEFTTPELEESKAYFVEDVDTINECTSERIIVLAVVDECLGIDIPEQNTLFTLYPNPAKGALNIQSNTTNNEPAKIQLISIEGKVILEESTKDTNHTVNLDAVPKGLYFCKIEVNNKTEVFKVLIEK